MKLVMLCEIGAYVFCKKFRLMSACAECAGYHGSKNFVINQTLIVKGSYLQQQKKNTQSVVRFNKFDGSCMMCRLFIFFLFALSPLLPGHVPNDVTSHLRTCVFHIYHSCEKFGTLSFPMIACGVTMFFPLAEFQTPVNYANMII